VAITAIEEELNILMMTSHFALIPQIRSFALIFNSSPVGEETESSASVLKILCLALRVRLRPAR
jgi:hypothetical protein